MKTIISIAILFLFVQLANAQNIEFYKKSGNMITVNLSEVVNIWFSKNPNAIKLKKTDSTILTFSFAEIDSLIFDSSQTSSITVNDIEGNTYKAVVIGTQTWIAENLKVTKYYDGTTIPLVTSNSAWNALATPAYCNYKNTTNADTINMYGRLYNWYTVNTNKLCPMDWHVSTVDEWTTLTTFLGGEMVAGGKVKEAGTVHWNYPNKNATNETNFTALPGGNRIDGSFTGIGYLGYWWSSTENDSTYAWNSYMHYYNGYLVNSYYNKSYGFSVRCVRD